MAALIEVHSQRKHALGANTVIGRASSAEIRIDDPLVSSSHAAIVRREDGSFHVRDLASRRGTYVGDHKITEQALSDGDELLIGPMRLRFVADATPTHDAEEELAKLRAVVELGRAIGVEHDLERLLARVLDTCFQLVRADRGALVIYQPGSKAPFLTITRARSGDHAFAVSASVLGQVMITHQPYLRTEVDSDVVLQRSESLTAHGVRSVMAVPLRYDATEPEWLGVILLDSSAMAKVFSRRDLELLEAISGPTALAVKNAMLVRQVQDVISDEWRRLERVVRDLPLGVVVLDDRRRCVMLNRWVGARTAELGAIVPGEPIGAIAGISCDQLAGSERRTTVTTESDRILSITASTMSEGRETVVVISDLTEERERQNQAAHRDRVALIGQLAGGVAHDFNNLLHVILTYANMLEDSIENADLRDDAHQIAHAARSAAELTRQLLTFSRRELVKPKVVDVATTIRRMEKIITQTLGPRMSFELSIAQRVPRILIDASQLEQIVMNLVVNARDAMDGAGTIRVAVASVELAHEVRGLTAGTYVQIEVTDDGVGMAPEVVARIFEPYFTTKTRGKGTGLGLATVHGIVQQGRGEITVDSTPGAGTTFRIRLPATDQTGEEPRPVPTSAGGGATILVVDDDDDVRRVTQRILKHAGYQVLAASSGPEALAIARQHPGMIELLLTDVVMPGMSGRDLARELEQGHRVGRVIFMSGYHQHAPIANSQFISKPFNRAELLDKVREQLDVLRGDDATHCA